MKEIIVTVRNKLGLHARAAALLVEAVARFKSDIALIKEGHEVDAKSIMGVMMLAAEMGSVITIQAEGVDEQECVDELVKSFAVRFDDE